jgi:hypothetical protein
MAIGLSETGRAQSQPEFHLQLSAAAVLRITNRTIAPLSQEARGQKGPMSVSRLPRYCPPARLTGLAKFKFIRETAQPV